MTREAFDLRDTTRSHIKEKMYSGHQNSKTNDICSGVYDIAVVSCKMFKYGGTLQLGNNRAMGGGVISL